MIHADAAASSCIRQAAAGKRARSHEHNVAVLRALAITAGRHEHKMCLIMMACNGMLMAIHAAAQLATAEMEGALLLLTGMASSSKTML